MQQCTSAFRRMQDGSACIRGNRSCGRSLPKTQMHTSDKGGAARARLSSFGCRCLRFETPTPFRLTWKELFVHRTSKRFQTSGRIWKRCLPGCGLAVSWFTPKDHIVSGRNRLSIRRYVCFAPRHSRTTMYKPDALFGSWRLKDAPPMSGPTDLKPLMPFTMFCGI